MLLIATPTYNSMVCTDYLHTVINLKIPYSIITVDKDPLITRARNKIFSIFLQYPHFSHLLFLDADIGVYSDDIQRLISRKKDIIGAPIPLRYYSNKIIYDYGKILDNSSSNPVIEVDRVSSSLMLITRKLAKDVADYAKKNNWIYYLDISDRSNQVNKIYVYDVFRTKICNNEYLSDEHFFCNLCRKLGYKIYIDLTIKVKRHNII